MSLFWLYILSINAFTFLLFWLDKHYARKGYWRIPESILLGVSLAGGSPFAFVAQRLLRHKTSKRSFQIRFWLVAVIQLGVLAYLYSYPNITEFQLH